mmetsp:Transcript_27421/g.37592  ORF Transcript_27421/g.37592 Transcript_27421/m.37592 type:complete len:658 (-) Transcript_27421:381-2354(-)
MWTIEQQRSLDDAIACVPREGLDSKERWTRIAEKVPGRSLKECVARYRELRERLQNQQQAKVTTPAGSRADTGSLRVSSTKTPPKQNGRIRGGGGGKSVVAATTLASSVTHAAQPSKPLPVTNTGWGIELPKAPDPEPGTAPSPASSANTKNRRAAATPSLSREGVGKTPVPGTPPERGVVSSAGGRNGKKSKGRGGKRAEGPGKQAAPTPKPSLGTGRSKSTRLPNYVPHDIRGHLVEMGTIGDRRAASFLEGSAVEGGRGLTMVDDDCDVNPHAVTGGAQWWRSLELDDPISLEPLCDLPYPPFDLVAPPPSPNTVSADNSDTSEPKTLPIQYFDGQVLAYYLVSTFNFTNPLSRSPLSRADCYRLDGFLRAHRLPAAGVTEAWDIHNRGGHRTQAEEASDSVWGGSGRSESLRRDASALFRSLFRFDTDVLGPASSSSIQPSDSRQRLPPPTVSNNSSASPQDAEEAADDGFVTPKGKRKEKVSNLAARVLGADECFGSALYTRDDVSGGDIATGYLYSGNTDLVDCALFDELFPALESKKQGGSTEEGKTKVRKRNRRKKGVKGEQRPPPANNRSVIPKKKGPTEYSLHNSSTSFLTAAAPHLTDAVRAYKGLPPHAQAKTSAWGVPAAPASVSTPSVGTKKGKKKRGGGNGN